MLVSPIVHSCLFYMEVSPLLFDIRMGYVFVYVSAAMFVLHTAALFLSSVFFLYKQHMGVLELVVQWYNKVKQTVLEVEYPLIETDLRTVDDLLMEAEETFTWQEENCWEYIEHVKATVYDLEERLQRSKDNIKAIQRIMKDWMEQPMFYRKDNKKEGLLNLEDKEDRLSKKFMSLREDGYKIHTLAQVIYGIMSSAVLLHASYPPQLSSFLW